MRFVLIGHSAQFGVTPSTSPRDCVWIAPAAISPADAPATQRTRSESNSLSAWKERSPAWMASAIPLWHRAFLRMPVESSKESNFKVRKRSWIRCRST